MAPADQLLERMFSWIEAGVRCAELLEKLANELESVRKKCSIAELVGIIVQVLAAVFKILANIAILWTPASGAAPVLFVLEKAFRGVSFIITATAEVVQRGSYYFTLKEAEEIVKKLNMYTETIQNQLKQMRAEVKKKLPSAGSHEVDRHVVTEIVRAVARRSGLKQEDDFSTEFYFNADQKMVKIQQSSEELYSAAAAAKDHAVNIYQFFSSLTGNTDVSAGDARLEAVKGGCELMMVGRRGINKWNEMYQVSEVSQSLKDAADAIRETCRTQKKQFDVIERSLEKMARRRRQERIVDRKSVLYLIVGAVLSAFVIHFLLL
ncbi:uncharacterized protein [Pagrus major]|uniref:uncharacterized protein isoform X1 n=1 Tax=Pagrus major TaxID=143350 RepID=UPI003CC864E2